jgi:hypothetical protein
VSMNESPDFRGVVDTIWIGNVHSNPAPTTKIPSDSTARNPRISRVRLVPSAGPDQRDVLQAIGGWNRPSELGRFSI